VLGRGPEDEERVPDLEPAVSWRVRDDLSLVLEGKHLHAEAASERKVLEGPIGRRRALAQGEVLGDEVGETPSGRSRATLRFRPTKKSTKTRPRLAREWTFWRLLTSAKGGVCGPITIPATRYPTMIEMPSR
jgi:hypothetical protein